jgi:hypothetical protein
MKAYTVKVSWVDGTKEAADFDSFHSATRFFKPYVADFAVFRVCIVRNCPAGTTYAEVIAEWRNMTA